MLQQSLENEKVYLNRKEGGGCTRLVVFNLFLYRDPL